MKLFSIILSFVALINMLALAGVILIKNPRSLKNKILLGIVFQPIYTLSLALLRYLGVLSNSGYFVAFDYVSNYVWPVLVYLYVKLSLEQKVEKKNVLIYFLPAQIILMVMIGLCFSNGGKEALTAPQNQQHYILITALEIPFMVLSFFYLLLSRAKVVDYLKRLKEDSLSVSSSLILLKNFIQMLFLAMSLVVVAIFIFSAKEYILIFLSIAIIIPYFFFFSKLLSETPFPIGPEKDFQEGSLEQKSEKKEIIMVKSGRKHAFIKISEVLFARSEEKYTRIHLKKTNYLSDYTLSELEKRYPHYLTRIHRNALVNIEGIKNLEKLPGGKLKLFMEDGSSLEVSRRMAENIKPILQP